MNNELLLAKEELGNERFKKHFRKVFNNNCLDFVETIVLNLPEPCYADCEYCIDKELRKNAICANEFLAVCKKVLAEFPNAKNVSITGGTLSATSFYQLICLIKEYLPSAFIIWNTNGVNLDKSYEKSISGINYINLHRNAISEKENAKVFKANRKIITLEEAKQLIGDKLFIRVTVDNNFDFDEFIKLKIPLYLNRFIPVTVESETVFKDIINKLNIKESIIKRRNVYLDTNYSNIPVRICLGDSIANHIPGRIATYLNVAIVHRSGIVCGSWFEDDKVIYSNY